MAVKKAVIIAAGQGSRLRRGGLDLPKPLHRVAGLPLLKRIILAAKKAGIKEFVIVVGYEKNRIIHDISSEDLGVKIEFVENKQWMKSNGISVLAARASVNEDFVLLMSDHIFDPQTLQNLRQAPLKQNQALLAVDYGIQKVFDLADATKIESHNGQIQKIGKNLAKYNAIDTGMFLATPALFEALEAVKKDDNCALSDGIQYLAKTNQMGSFDIGQGFWQDVDDTASLKYAEKQLLNQCRKTTDGIISRHINRHVSLFITSLLIKTNLSANHVTGLTMVVGILSAVFVARGDYWNVLLGAFLFQLASILDGCDGEISKLKLTSTKLGQWLDTLSDNLTYVLFMVGVVIGAGYTHDPQIRLLGILTLFGVVMTVFVMFSYLLRHTDSGSLLALQKEMLQQEQKGFLYKAVRATYFTVKRDFFAFAFFIFALGDGLQLILWSTLIGANITWMILLSKKLGLFKPATVVIKGSPESTKF